MLFLETMDLQQQKSLRKRLDPPWNTGQKKFFEKITPKHVQNTFGHFRERFWAFLEF